MYDTYCIIIRLKITNLVKYFTSGQIVLPQEIILYDLKCLYIVWDPIHIINFRLIHRKIC